ncbi:MAG TPA: regulatory protein RecX [Steroidobacteraceae bacterium]|nr:regulatory protein RecX [Steroidobacteraceae bacterium]
MRGATGSRGVRAAALALLARRDFATAELREKLEQRGFERSEVAAAIAELLAEHSLDDARFAQAFVMYHAQRGQGPVRIAADLKARGLTGALIEAALADGPDWNALAREVRRRRFGPQDPAASVQKRRQARFLQYRGFSSDHIRRALGPEFDPDDPS